MFFVEIGAAAALALTQTAWPDLSVAGPMATLFLSSARQIIWQALNERGGHEARP